MCLLCIDDSCLWLNVDLDIPKYCGFEYIWEIWKNVTLWHMFVWTLNGC